MKKSVKKIFIQIFLLSIISLLLSSCGSKENVFVGDWMEIEQPSRWVRITNSDSGYMFETSDGDRFPSTYKDNKLEISTGWGNAVAYYEKETEKLILLFMDEEVQYTRRIESTTNDNTSRGNSAGNNVNHSRAAYDNGWAYYGFGNSLYKINQDGSNKTKLSEDGCSFLNVTDDWIYYSNNNENSALYKMKIDGTERIKLSDDSCQNISISNGWIFYSVYYAEFGELYKIRMDGTEKTKIRDLGAGYVNIVDDWVYFVNQDDNSKIYKMKTDGTGEVKLNDDESRFLCVEGDWIYFSNTSKNAALYKIKTDGSKETKLSNDSSEYLNVSGGWIYYSNASKNRSLYKVKLDGSDNSKICDDKSMDINVVQDWIYYLKDMNGDYLTSWLHKIRTDGTGLEKILE